MTLLFMDGFDPVTTTTNTRWSSGGAGSYASPGRTGIGQYARYGQGGFNNKILQSNESAIVMGFGYYREYEPSGMIVSLVESGTTQCWLHYDGVFDRFQAYGPGSTLLGSSANNSVMVYTWYYVEIKVTIHNTAGSFEVHIDSNQVINATSVDTQATANAYVNEFGILSPGWYGRFDDIYFCNQSGSQCNDFLGDVRVETLYPSGAGTYAQWTPSAGSNYQNVDEHPPDGDSTYNDGDTINDIDSYALDNLVTTSGTIYATQELIYAKKNSAGTVKYRPHIRTNSVDYTGDEITPTASYAYSSYIRELNPNDSLPWDVTDINAIEGGIKRTV